MKKTATALLFIGVITLPFWFLPGFLLIQKEQVRYAVKEQMKHQLPEENFQTLRFSTEEAEQVLEWEHAKEFKYQGAMYDVVEQTATQDSIVFKVWKDDDETAINRQIDAVVTSLFSQPDPAQQAHLLSYIKTMIHYQAQWTVKPQSGSYRKKTSGLYTFNYSDPELTSATPPPRLN